MKNILQLDKLLLISDWASLLVGTVHAYENKNV